MRVQFWGVRGSIAVSGERFVQMGGNTTCVVLEHEGHHLILDGGTGLKAFGDSLHGKPITATLVFTHVHWDHIQGLPFFGPAFHPGSQISVRACPRDGWHFKDILSLQMAPPTFPVRLNILVGLREIEDFNTSAPLDCGPFRVWSIEQAHPDGVVVYRVEAGGRSVVFATDVEHGGVPVSDAFVEFCRGCDLLIHDAQYTAEEYAGQAGPPRKGWGHCMWTEAVEVARRAQVGRLALFHHDPGRADEAVLAIEREAQALFAGSFAAREGQVVDLAAAP